MFLTVLVPPKKVLNLFPLSRLEPGNMMMRLVCYHYSMLTINHYTNIHTHMYSQHSISQVSKVNKLPTFSHFSYIYKIPTLGMGTHMDVTRIYLFSKREKQIAVVGILIKEICSVLSPQNPSLGEEEPSLFLSFIPDNFFLCISFTFAFSPSTFLHLQ